MCAIKEHEMAEVKTAIGRDKTARGEIKAD